MKEGKKRDFDISLDFKYFVLIFINYYMNNYSVSVTFCNATADILKYVQCKFHVTDWKINSKKSSEFEISPCINTVK